MIVKKWGEALEILEDRASGNLYLTAETTKALREYFAKEKAEQEVLSHIDSIVDGIKADIRKGRKVGIDQRSCPIATGTAYAVTFEVQRPIERRP